MSLSKDVFNNKYAAYEGESIDGMFERAANDFAIKELETFKQDISIEEFDTLSEYGKIRHKRISDYIQEDCNELQSIKEDIKKLFTNFDIIPGGSALSGLGTKQPVSLSNCFVIASPKDSISGINAAINNADNIYKRRGGVGIDVSSIRPRGTQINNAAKKSTGIVPMIEHKFSESTSYIAQDGRRGALMITLDVNHPDIFEFVEAKENLSKINGANISVKINDGFMRCVMDDSDYILSYPTNLEEKKPKTLEFLMQAKDEWNYNELVKFEDLYLKKIKARDLWSKIIHSAWKCAEPGVLFWDTISNRDPSSVYPTLKPISTNPLIHLAA